MYLRRLMILLKLFAKTCMLSSSTSTQGIIAPFNTAASLPSSSLSLVLSSSSSLGDVRIFDVVVDDDDYYDHNKQYYHNDNVSVMCTIMMMMWKRRRIKILMMMMIIRMTMMIKTMIVMILFIIAKHAKWTDDLVR